MKNTMKKGIIIAGLMLGSAVAFGQPGNPDTPVPLDGGISLLIAAGAAYGGKKLYQAKKAQ